VVFEQFVYVGDGQKFLLITNNHHDRKILDFGLEIFGGINPKYSLRCVRFANANLKSVDSS
jgi:hypothetical protein